MKKIVNCGICLLLIFTLIVPILAIENQSEAQILSDVPYDYGNVYHSEKWESMTIPERKAIYTLKLDKAKSLSTKALLETIITNPYFMDIYAYDTLELGISAKEHQFQFNELFSRSDIENVLISYINDIVNKYGFETEDDLISALYSSVEEETLAADKLICCRLLLGYLSSNLSSMNPMSQNATYGTVQTLDGRQVPCVYDRTWLNQEGGQANALSFELKYLKEYPNSIKISPMDPAYNCHSYAWHKQITTSKVWIESTDAKMYLSDLNCFRVGSPASGRKVVYFTNNNNTMDHSGIVESVSGNKVTVVSKWGALGLYRHPLEDSPYYSTASAIFYYIYEKQ